MKREDLRPYLDREVAKWSAKSYQTLREVLRDGSYADAANPQAEYHLEVDLVENRDDYVHVNVAVLQRARPLELLPPAVPQLPGLSRWPSRQVEPPRGRGW